MDPLSGNCQDHIPSLLDINVAPVETPSLPGTPLLENTVPAYLEGKFKVFPLVDSGASHSVIAIETLRKIRRNAVISPLPSQTAQTADGSSIPILGKIQLHITLGKMTVPIQLLVVPHLSQDLIIGRDFLRLHKAQIDFSKNRLVLHRQFPLKHDLI